MTTEPMTICAIIPAYNQAGTISAVVAATQQFIADVIVINDGSQDATAQCAAAAGAVVLEQQKNSGKGAALKQGFAYACAHAYDAVITLDGDGQHDPADIPRLLAAAEHADIVIGCRMRGRQGMPILNFISNAVLSFCISLITGCRIHDTQSGFRLLRRSVIAGLTLTTNRYETESEQLIKAAHAGMTITEIPIRTIYLSARPRRTIVADFFDFLKLLCAPRLSR